MFYFNGKLSPFLVLMIGWSSHISLHGDHPVELHGDDAIVLPPLSPSRTAFAKNEKRPVIVPLVPKVIGHGNSLSNLDVVRIHSLYKGEWFIYRKNWDC